MSEETAEIARMERLFAAQKATQPAIQRRSADDRKADLTALLKAVIANADKLARAVAADYGTRAAIETHLAETYYVVESARHAQDRIAGWMRPTRIRIQPLLQPGKVRVEHVPKGVVGVISPWNYPVQLSLVPIIDALGAGCRVMLKPSELTPNTSAALKEMLASIFAEDQVAVVTGGADIAAAFAGLPFDHLMFTGSAATGRKVLAETAANLTPVTLELGGKSPAIVADDYALETAAKSIAWGKFINAGQTCVANDHVLVSAARARPLADAILKAVSAMYPGGAADPTYASIISDRHHARLQAMIAEARDRGATVLEASSPAPSNQRKIAPTIILDPPSDTAVMQEEIFGPILPVISVPSLDAAIAHVAAGERPLAVYVYSTDKAAAAHILARTISGGATINQPFLHMTARDAPFGGVGASGTGAYHGHAGFLTFSHQRPVFTAGPRHPSRWLAPPYRRIHERFVRWRLRG